MADIASALKLAEGTIYLYFENKRALTVAVITTWFAEIVDETEARAQAASSPLDRLRLLIQSHLELILGNPPMYLLFIREVRASSDYESTGGRALNRRYTDLLRPCVQQLEKASLLSFPLVRDIVYGGVEHVAWSAIMSKERCALPDIRALAIQLADTYLRILRPVPVATTEPADIEGRLQRLEQAMGLRTRSQDFQPDNVEHRKSSL